MYLAPGADVQVCQKSPRGVWRGGQRRSHRGRYLTGQEPVVAELVYVPLDRGSAGGMGAARVVRLPRTSSVQVRSRMPGDPQVPGFVALV